MCVCFFFFLFKRYLTSVECRVLTRNHYVNLIYARYCIIIYVKNFSAWHLKYSTTVN